MALRIEWRRRAGALLLALTVMAFPLEGADAQTLPGAARQPGLYTPNGALQSPPLRVEVLDGTSFRDIETKQIYRLYGVDSCAPGQLASLGRQPWPCGTMATAWLVSATLNKWVACNVIKHDGPVNYGRCASPEHQDIAADMLRDGMAVSLPPTEGDPAIRAYVAAEQEARKAYRGLWASSFQMPWDFRKNGSPAAALHPAPSP